MVIIVNWLADTRSPAYEIELSRLLKSLEIQMMQHQIVQSPARLGLPNPASPSVQNPTPPKFSSPSAAATSVTSGASAALLHLLPPLPRAQAILSLMASITSKLFEISSNRQLWLSSFRHSIPTFLKSPLPVPPLHSSPTSTKEILTLFSSLQSQLFEAVSELQGILDLQDVKNRIAREVRGKDTSLLNFAHKLKDAERVLDQLLDDYSDYRRPKRAKLSSDDSKGTGDEETGTTLTCRIKLPDILSYAHRISYTTFAPPEFGAGKGPLRGALPPAPQDEQMRASLLYNFADLDLGLPKEMVTVEKTIEAIVDPPTMLEPSEPNPLGSLASLLSPNFMVPSGWKPGMPVELPKELPVPPPGWKPGDPLPPLESIQMSKLLEQQFAQTTASHIVAEPIHVRHVQLDILDHDDDSSDYTSNEGSSGDED